MWPQAPLLSVWHSCAALAGGRAGSPWGLPGLSAVLEGLVGAALFFCFEVRAARRSHGTSAQTWLLGSLPLPLPSPFPPLSLLPFFPSFLFLLCPLFPLYYTSNRQMYTFFFKAFYFVLGYSPIS